MQCETCGTTETPKWYKKKTECKSCHNKAYYSANREKMNLLRRNWLERNPGKKAAYDKKFKTDHLETYLKIHRFEEAKRRAAKLKATPPWLTKDQIAKIREIYLNCPDGHHVDHIMPLRGKELCGLHVPWNLQYLPAEVNMAKSNKVHDILGSNGLRCAI